MNELAFSVAGGQAAPRTMVHPVAADRHAVSRELDDAVLVQAPGGTDPAGDDEERAFQTALEERLKADLDVGSVPVVEADPNAVDPGDRVEDPVERIDRDPVRRFIRLEDAAWRPDAVKADSVDNRFVDAISCRRPPSLSE
jgi:hypothetical protein